MRSPRIHLAHRQEARSQARLLYLENPSEEAIAARHSFEAFRWFVKKHKTFAHHRSWEPYLNTGEDSRCLDAIAGNDLLLLAPRGSSKSTFLIEWVAWQIGRHASPEIRQALKILYVSYELKTARQKSQQVKRLLMLPEYKKVFPWIKPGENWANELWEIDFNHAGLPAAEEPYTLAAAGLIGNLTGKRCLTGDAFIQTQEAFTPIKAFHRLVGTDVLSFNTVSLRAEWCKVKGFAVREADRLVEVKTQQGRSLRCTPDHRIFSLNKGYPEARNLMVGDRLVAATNGNVPTVDEVVGVEYLSDRKELVYDIEVEGNHNFFANDLLTHNCHLSVFDDLIKSPESIANPDIRDQMVSNYRNIIKPTRFDGGRSVCLGTRMRPDDIYCTEYTPENGWDVIEQSAIITHPDGSEESYWEPEDDSSPGQTLVFLQDIREKEPETFSYQYQNKVVAIKSQAIAPGLITRGLIPNKMEILVLGVDLSAGVKEKNDFTAFSLGGMAFNERRHPHYYTIDCWEGRTMGNMAKLEAIEELYNCWKHLCKYMEIWVESNGYQLSFAGDYQDYVAERGLYDWRVHPVPSTRDKLQRLRGVTGILENGCHTFNTYGRLIGKLTLQLTQWGSTGHDDLGDSWEKMLSGLRARHPLTGVNYNSV